MKKIIIFVCLALIAILMIVGVYAYKNIRIEKITVNGNERQDVDTIINTIFSDNSAKSYLKLWYEYNHKEQKEIALVEEYDIEFKGFNEIIITVYEKNIVGFIKNMGMNWYFDKDGIITECTEQIIDNVMFLDGLNVEYLVVGEAMPIKNESSFEIYLQLEQLIKGYKEKLDKIYNDKNMKIDRIIIEDNANFYMVMDKVTIDFGKGDMITEKMHDLIDLLPTLENVKGVLNMREYDVNDKGYNFKKE